MKTNSFVAALCGVSMFAFAADKDPRPSLHFLPSELTWIQPNGPQGPSFAFVVGAFGVKGAPASYFARFPAGADSGWHIHEEDHEAVVLKGTMTEQQQGATQTLLPAGTYFTQRAKMNHRNGCTKESDCLLYIHFDKGATSIPMTPEGKPVPASAAAATKVK